MFKRFGFPVSAVMACMLVVSCANNNTTNYRDNNPPGGLISAAHFAEIQSEVSTLRGLTFKRPVHIGYITSDEYAISVFNQVNSQYSDFQDSGLTSELYQLGVMPSDSESAKQTIEDFESGFPAAYYVDGTDSLYIISNQVIDTGELSYTIAHELTHALQDQYGYLSIQPFPLASQAGSDAYLARTSLIEGDAMTDEGLFAYTYVYPPYWGTPAMNETAFADTGYVDFLAYTDTYAFPLNGPAYYSASGYAPYDLGNYFVSTTCNAGANWPAVNAYYTENTLPKCMAQIIRMQNVEPTWIDLHAVQNLLLNNTSGLGFVDDDNLGPIVIMTSLYEHPGSLAAIALRNATDSAFDWTGDHMTYVQQRGSRSGTLVWALTFSNTQSAGLFFNYLNANFGGRRSAQTDTTFSPTDSLQQDSTGYERRDYAADSVVSRVAMYKTAVWWIDNAGNLTPAIDSTLKQQFTAGVGLAKTAVYSRPANAFSTEVKARIIKAISGGKMSGRRPHRQARGGR